MRLKNGDVCLAWPLENHIITQGYIYNDGASHKAIDMRAIIGTPVFAAEDGDVATAYKWDGIRTTGDVNSYGNMVKIRHAQWKGGTLETLYGHLNSMCVKAGQRVKVGELIGYSGNTGNSFGGHLHFEVRYRGVRTNPLVWLDDDFKLATGKEYTFAPGEHSVVVDKNIQKPIEEDKTYNSAGTAGSTTGVSVDNEIWGIDVSKYQGTINWRKVSASGVKFAMLRVVSTDKNGIYVDPTFEQNYKGATEAGIPVGAYFFTYAQDVATQNKELETLFKALEGKKFDYPIALDIEDVNTASIGKYALTNIVKRGLDIIDQKGYMPILYTYTNYKNKYLDMGVLKDYDLWLADTRSSYNGRGKSAIWQYGQETIAGISGKCDVNYCYKQYVKKQPTNVPQGSEQDKTKAKNKIIVFNRGSWNVRLGPGTNYSSVGVITNPDPRTGKNVIISYDQIVDGWYKTVYGYVGPGAVKDIKNAIVLKNGKWNVRSGPGTNYVSVGAIVSPSPKNGETVVIGYEGITDGWYKTVYGYIGPGAVLGCL